MKGEIQERLDALNRSPFRARIRLGAEAATVDQKGIETIRQHARDLLVRRLAPANPPNDGKQTPFRGHPVFIAQHATATCCRNCLEKWHHIPKGRPLNSSELEYVVDVIEAWLRRQLALRR